MTLLANHQLTPGWVQFGQPLPPGSAPESVRLRLQGATEPLRTQVDIKNRWPDGSIKFAVISAKVETNGTYALEDSSPFSGSFPVTQLPNFWLALHDHDQGREYGVQFFPHHAEPELWLDGPLVRQYRHRIRFTAGDGTPHPWLWCVLDVTTREDGTHVFDCCVENCQDAGGDTLSYDVYAGVDFGKGSQYLWNKYGVTHRYGWRWSKEFLVGPESLTNVPEEPGTIVPDLTPMVAAKALPQYSDNISPMTSYAWGEQFEILGLGSLESQMYEHGGRPELAPWPDWTARYLVRPDDFYQREFVLKHGELAGSWPVHFREEDGSLISIHQRPHYWLTWTGGAVTDGPGGVFHDSPHIPDVAHQPSLAYVPYLLTGRRFFIDELKFWANFCLLNTYAHSRGSNGWFLSQETRGYAWGLLRLVECASWIPDRDTMKPYFVQVLANNMNWLDWQEITAYDGKWHGPSVPPEWYIGPIVWNMLWQNNYLAFAVWWGHQQGFTGGEDYRNRIVRFQVGWLNDPDYRGGAAPYRLPMADGPGEPWYQTYEQAYSYFGESPFTGYYGIDARLICSVGLMLGVVGSQPGHDFVMSVAGMPQYAASRAGWYIVAGE